MSQGVRDRVDGEDAQGHAGQVLLGLQCWRAKHPRMHAGEGLRVEAKSGPHEPPHHAASAVVPSAVFTSLHRAEQAPALVAALVPRSRGPAVPDAPPGRAVDSRWDERAQGQE
eukprot:5541457-Pyramimonas_sp.AAC.1